ncbi:hypothetical protein [Borreliella valaisiana]
MANKNVNYKEKIFFKASFISLRYISFAGGSNRPFTRTFILFEK